MGLALSDGSLSGNRFTYTTISKKLSQDVKILLLNFNYNSTKIYVHNRKKYGWNDLNLVYTTRKESKELENTLNSILFKIGAKRRFREIK